jgi:predicted RNA-binding protein with EMAP domain
MKKELSIEYILNAYVKGIDENKNALYILPSIKKQKGADEFVRANKAAIIAAYKAREAAKLAEREQAKEDAKHIIELDILGWEHHTVAIDDRKDLNEQCQAIENDYAETDNMVKADQIKELYEWKLKSIQEAPQKRLELLRTFIKIYDGKALTQAQIADWMNRNGAEPDDYPELFVTADKLEKVKAELKKLEAEVK